MEITGRFFLIIACLTKTANTEVNKISGEVMLLHKAQSHGGEIEMRKAIDYCIANGADIEAVHFFFCHLTYNLKVLKN